MFLGRMRNLVDFGVTGSKVKVTVAKDRLNFLENFAFWITTLEQII
jgi:hypothetical protein